MKLKINFIFLLFLFFKIINNKDTKDDSFLDKITKYFNSDKNKDTKDDSFLDKNKDTKDDSFLDKNKDTKDDSFLDKNKDTKDDSFLDKNKDTKDDSFLDKNKDTKDDSFLDKIKDTELDKIGKITNILINIGTIVFANPIIYKYLIQKKLSWKKNSKKFLMKDIFGYEKEKKQLEKLIKKNTKNENMTCILIDGPPGTGKTCIANAIANKLKLSSINILPSHILNKLVGGTEEEMESILKNAQNNAPYVIIIDECESLFQNLSESESSVKDTHSNVQNLLLQYMDGYFNMKGVVLIGITNHKKLIDKRFLRPGRFHSIHIGLPSYEDRIALIKNYIKQASLQLDKDLTIEQMATKLEKKTGAEIKSIITDFEYTNNTINIPELENNIYQLINNNSEKQNTKIISNDNIIGYDKIKEKIEKEIKKNENQSNIICILLEGQPGTGKTSMAQAITHKLKIPTQVILPNEIFKKYIGESEQEINKILSHAQKNSPYCLIFDECEIIFGEKTESSEKTLSNIQNILLQYMDGCFDMKGVIIIGITNHKNRIDHSFLRRFNKIFHIGPPNKSDLIKIINYYISQKKLTLSTDITFEYMAEKLENQTAADIKGFFDSDWENDVITKNAFIDKLMELLIGEINEEIIIDKAEEYNTSIHEIGHALLTYIFATKYNGSEQFDFVTNTPRGDTLGSSHSKRLPVFKSTTKENMIQKIAISLGGKAAQEIILNKIDTGASSDLEKAKNIAEKMITEYGMGKHISGKYNKKELIKEINKIIHDEYKKVINFTTKYKNLIIKIAQTLMNKKIIYQEEFEKIVKDYEKNNNIIITY